MTVENLKEWIKQQQQEINQTMLSDDNINSESQLGDSSKLENNIDSYHSQFGEEETKKRLTEAIKKILERERARAERKLSGQEDWEDFEKEQGVRDWMATLKKKLTELDETITIFPFVHGRPGCGYGDTGELKVPVLLSSKVIENKNLFGRDIKRHRRGDLFFSHYRIEPIKAVHDGRPVEITNLTIKFMTISNRLIINEIPNFLQRPNEEVKEILEDADLGEIEDNLLTIGKQFQIKLHGESSPHKYYSFATLKDGNFYLEIANNYTLIIDGQEFEFSDKMKTVNGVKNLIKITQNLIGEKDLGEAEAYFQELQNRFNLVRSKLSPEEIVSIEQEITIIKSQLAPLESSSSSAFSRISNSSQAQSSSELTSVDLSAEEDGEFLMPNYSPSESTSSSQPKEQKVVPIKIDNNEYSMPAFLTVQITEIGRKTERCEQYLAWYKINPLTLSFTDSDGNPAILPNPQIQQIAIKFRQEKSDSRELLVEIPDFIRNNIAERDWRDDINSAQDNLIKLGEQITLEFFGTKSENYQKNSDRLIIDDNYSFTLPDGRKFSFSLSHSLIQNLQNSLNSLENEEIDNLELAKFQEIEEKINQLSNLEPDSELITDYGRRFGVVFDRWLSAKLPLWKNFLTDSSPSSSSIQELQPLNSTSLAKKIIKLADKGYRPEEINYNKEASAEFLYQSDGENFNPFIWFDKQLVNEYIKIKRDFEKIIAGKEAVEFSAPFTKKLNLLTSDFSSLEPLAKIEKYFSLIKSKDDSAKAVAAVRALLAREKALFVQWKKITPSSLSAILYHPQLEGYNETQIEEVSNLLTEVDNLQELLAKTPELTVEDIALTQPIIAGVNENIEKWKGSEINFYQIANENLDNFFELMPLIAEYLDHYQVREQLSLDNLAKYYFFYQDWIGEVRSGSVDSSKKQTLLLFDKTLRRQKFITRYDLVSCAWQLKQWSELTDINEEKLIEIKEQLTVTPDKYKWAAGKIGQLEFLANLWRRCSLERDIEELQADLLSETRNWTSTKQLMEEFEKHSQWKEDSLSHIGQKKLIYARFLELLFQNAESSEELVELQEIEEKIESFSRAQDIIKSKIWKEKNINRINLFFSNKKGELDEKLEQLKAKISNLKSEKEWEKNAREQLAELTTESNSFFNDRKMEDFNRKLRAWPTYLGLGRIPNNYSNFQNQFRLSHHEQINLLSERAKNQYEMFKAELARVLPQNCFYEQLEWVKTSIKTLEKYIEADDNPGYSISGEKLENLAEIISVTKKEELTARHLTLKKFLFTLDASLNLTQWEKSKIINNREITNVAELNLWEQKIKKLRAIKLANEQRELWEKVVIGSQIKEIDELINNIASLVNNNWPTYLTNKEQIRTAMNKRWIIDVEIKGAKKEKVKLLENDYNQVISELAQEQIYHQDNQGNPWVLSQIEKELLSESTAEHLPEAWQLLTTLRQITNNVSLDSYQVENIGEFNESYYHNLSTFASTDDANTKSKAVYKAFQAKLGSEKLNSIWEKYQQEKDWQTFFAEKGIEIEKSLWKKTDLSIQEVKNVYSSLSTENFCLFIKNFKNLSDLEIQQLTSEEIKMMKEWLTEKTGLAKDGVEEKQAQENGWKPREIKNKLVSGICYQFKDGENINLEELNIEVLKVKGDELAKALELKHSLARAASITDLTEIWNNKPNLDDNWLPSGWKITDLTEFYEKELEELHWQEFLTDFKGQSGEAANQSGEVIRKYYDKLFIQAKQEREVYWNGGECAKIFNAGWTDCDRLEVKEVEGEENTLGVFAGWENQWWSTTDYTFEEAREEKWINDFENALNRPNEDDNFEDKILPYRKDNVPAEAAAKVFENNWAVNDFVWKTNQTIISSYTSHGENDTNLDASLVNRIELDKVNQIIKQIKEAKKTSDLPLETEINEEKYNEKQVPENKNYDSIRKLLVEADDKIILKKLTDALKNLPENHPGERINKITQLKSFYNNDNATDAQKAAFAESTGGQTIEEAIARLEIAIGSDLVVKIVSVRTELELNDINIDNLNHTTQPTKGEAEALKDLARLIIEIKKNNGFTLTGIQQFIWELEHFAKGLITFPVNTIFFDIRSIGENKKWAWEEYNKQSNNKATDLLTKLKLLENKAEAIENIRAYWEDEEDNNNKIAGRLIGEILGSDWKNSINSKNSAAEIAAEQKRLLALITNYLSALLKIDEVLIFANHVVDLSSRQKALAQLENIRVIYTDYNIDDAHKNAWNLKEWTVEAEITNCNKFINMHNDAISSIQTAIDKKPKITDKELLRILQTEGKLTSADTNWKDYTDKARTENDILSRETEVISIINDYRDNLVKTRAEAIIAIKRHWTNLKIENKIAEIVGDNNWEDSFNNCDKVEIIKEKEKQFKKLLSQFKIKLDVKEIEAELNQKPIVLAQELTSDYKIIMINLAEEDEKRNAAKQQLITEIKSVRSAKKQRIRDIINQGQNILNQDDASYQSVQKIINNLKKLVQADNNTAEKMVWEENSETNQKLLTDLENKLLQMNNYGADFVALRTEQKKCRQQVCEKWKEKKNGDLHWEIVCSHCFQEFAFDTNLDYLSTKEKASQELKVHEAVCPLANNIEEQLKRQQNYWDKKVNSTERYFYSCQKCWGKICWDKSISDSKRAKQQALADWNKHSSEECGLENKTIAIYFSPNQGGNQHAPLSYAKKISNLPPLEEDNQGEVYQIHGQSTTNTPSSNLTPWLIGGIILLAGGIIAYFVAKKEKQNHN